MGQALRELRDNWAGLTQEALADKHGDLSKSTISARERAEGLPSSRFLDAFVTSCLQHKGWSAAGIITELGHWQQARNVLYRQRRAHTAVPDAGDGPSPAPPVAAAVSMCENPVTGVPAQSKTTPASEPAGGGASPVPEPSGRRSRHKRWLGAGGLVAAVIVVGVAVMGFMGRPGPNTAAQGGPGHDRTTASTVEPAQPLVSSPPYVAGKVYNQTVNSSAGARTYTNPYGPIGEGRRIDNHTTVQVSCKVIAPGGSTIGTYWYRIAGQPWNNQYYSPTNSFLNDDPITGRHDKVVDDTVPYCPT